MKIKNEYGEYNSITFTKSKQLRKYSSVGVPLFLCGRMSYVKNAVDWAINLYNMSENRSLSRLTSTYHVLFGK